MIYLISVRLRLRLNVRKKHTWQFHGGNRSGLIGIQRISVRLLGKCGKSVMFDDVLQIPRKHVHRVIPNFRQIVSDEGFSTTGWTGIVNRSARSVSVSPFFTDLADRCTVNYLHRPKPLPHLYGKISG
jgi:hypothetical protein